jgi:hypothetical protein
MGLVDEDVELRRQLRRRTEALDEGYARGSGSLPGGKSPLKRPTDVAAPQLYAACVEFTLEGKAH